MKFPGCGGEDVGSRWQPDSRWDLRHPAPQSALDGPESWQTTAKRVFPALRGVSLRSTLLPVPALDNLPVGSFLEVGKRSDVQLVSGGKLSSQDGGVSSPVRDCVPGNSSSKPLCVRRPKSSLLTGIPLSAQTQRFCVRGLQAHREDAWSVPCVSPTSHIAKFAPAHSLFPPPRGSRVTGSRSLWVELLLKIISKPLVLSECSSYRG